MKDYPELNMFIVDGPVSVSVSASADHPFVVVSSFSDTLSEKEAVGFIRNIYLEAPESRRGKYGSPPGLFYGDDFGIVVFYPNDYALKEVREYCLSVAERFNQPGIIVYDGSKAFLEKLDGTETVLSPWDKTQDRFEEWCQHLHSGFKIKGIWNRQASYIRMRHAQIEGKIK